MFSDLELVSLRQDLLAWFGRMQRDLPWRRTKDPYSIWVSEAMLQQTRVAAVLPYYQRFLERFPTFQSLAAASESEVLAQWAGLGYYYRARNLQKAARLMAAAGSFPSAHAQIRLLPGVGDYTAAAVASIAFGLPHAVLDGNVFRVLSRLFADPIDISSAQGRKHFAILAGHLLDRDSAGSFNQAMMELGATICLNRNPQCLLCPVTSRCRAREAGIQHSFPVNKAKQVSVKEHRTLFWVEHEARVLAWQRPPASRLMAGFWELPEIAQLTGLTAGQKAGSFRHGITIHSYSFDVIECDPPADNGACKWLPLSELKSLPVSTIFKKAARVIANGRGKEAPAFRTAET